MLNLVLIVISTLVISAFIMFSFLAGLHYGSKVKNNEVINIPNPGKAIQKRKAEHRFEMETKKEKEYIEDVFHNIDIYNGTSEGQKTISKVV